MTANQYTHLNLGDRVEIHSTKSQLDGALGTLLGVSVSGYDVHPHIQIVMLDEPLETHKAITMTEACLKKKT